MGGRRRRRRLHGVYFSSWLPPSRRLCGRPRLGELGAGRPPRPGARSGPVLGARLPAGLALPRRLAAWARSTAEDPRPGPDESLCRAEDPRPSQAPPAGPAQPVRRDERLGGTLLAESARARRGSRPRIVPDAGSCGGCAGRGGGWQLEGAKMALGLAHRQGWWRSCSAGAIFPGGAGGALWGRLAARSSRRSGAWGLRSGGRNLYLGPGPSSLVFPSAPRPERRGRWLGAGRGWGRRHLVPFTTCVEGGSGLRVGPRSRGVPSLNPQPPPPPAPVKIGGEGFPSSSYGLNLDGFAFPGPASGRAWRLFVHPLPLHFESKVEPGYKTAEKRVEDSVCLPSSIVVLYRSPMLVFLVGCVFTTLERLFFSCQIVGR